MFAWVETSPEPEEEIVSSNTQEPAPVAPGDVVVSTITEDSSSVYTFSMDDETQGWTVDAEQAMPSGYTGPGQTSEVITEATTECTSASASSCSVVPFTNFGNVAYTSATYNSRSTYTSSNTTPIELVQSGGVGDTVGALGAGGAFAGDLRATDRCRPQRDRPHRPCHGRGRDQGSGPGSEGGGRPPQRRQPAFQVTAESPAAGTRVPVGTTVTLTYTLAKVTVPSEQSARPTLPRPRPGSGQRAWCRGRWAPAASGTRERSPLSPGGRDQGRQGVHRHPDLHRREVAFGSASEKRPRPGEPGGAACVRESSACDRLRHLVQIRDGVCTFRPATGTRVNPISSTHCRMTKVGKPVRATRARAVAPAIGSSGRQAGTSPSRGRAGIGGRPRLAASTHKNRSATPPEPGQAYRPFISAPPTGHRQGFA